MNARNASRPPEQPTRFNAESLLALGPFFLGLSFALQFMLTALLVLGPSRTTAGKEGLTEYGKNLVAPEHELFIYAVGVLGSCCLIWLVVWYWRKRLTSVAEQHIKGYTQFSAVIYALGGVLSLALFLSVVASRFHTIREPSSEWPLLLVPCAMTAVWVILDTRYGCPGLSGALQHEIQRGRLAVRRFLTFGTVIFIFTCIAVTPRWWTDIAGKSFLIDQCHHLNFFAMAPALSFSHGKALGTEVFAQYGVGWPVITSWFSAFSSLTYGNFVGLAVVYGCIYYLGLYYLLHLWFKPSIWAAVAVLLAIYWQFSGIPWGCPFWLFPSSTVLRHPMDVWVFLALLLHARSGKTPWLLLAGLFAGLGITLETETGCYLLAVFVVYWTLGPGITRPSGWRLSAKAFLLRGAVFYAGVAVSLIPALGYASRGTLFTLDFWRGWLEPLFMYGSRGVGAIPIAELATDSMVFFVAILLTFLGVFGGSVMRRLRRGLAWEEVLLGTMAAYGLMLLLLFVHRSHPYNLYRAAVPFAVVLTGILVRSREALVPVLAHTSFPYAVACGVVLLLDSRPEFVVYPNVLQYFSRARSPENFNLRLRPNDITSLPPESEEFIRDFNGACDALLRLHSRDQFVAILDIDETLFYSTTKLAPWHRYGCLFDMSLTEEHVNRACRDLDEKRPGSVLIRGERCNRPHKWDFVWRPLYNVVQRSYTLRETVGPYEIWVLRSSVPGGNG